MVNCMAKFCKVSSRNNPRGAHWHMFPKNAYLHRRWLDKCGRLRVKDKRARVCSEHFTHEDYENLLQFEMGHTERLRLKPDAVPSVFNKPRVGVGPAEGETSSSRTPGGINLLQPIMNARSRRKEAKLRREFLEELLTPSISVARNPAKCPAADQTPNLNLNHLYCPNSQSDQQNLHSEASKSPHTPKPPHVTTQVVQEPQHIKQEEEPQPTCIHQEAATEPPRIKQEEELEPLYVEVRAAPELPQIQQEAAPESPHIEVEVQEAEPAEWPMALILKLEDDQAEGAQSGAASTPQVQISVETGGATSSSLCRANGFSISADYVKIKDHFESSLPIQVTIISTKNAKLVEEMETNLSAWIEDQRQKLAPLNLEIIKEKAQQLYELMKVHGSENALSQNCHLDHSVKSLLMTPFKKRTLEQQLAVKECGPRRPEIVDGGSQQHKRSFSRTWLTTCSETRAFFCFPCLLFQRTESDQSWSKTGVSDLKHFSDKAEQHEQSAVHLENATRLAMLGKVSIARQLDESYKRAVCKHNQEVDEKRKLLSQMIDSVKSCDAFEFALRDESGSWENPDIFRALVNFGAILDAVLHKYLKNTAVFQGTSKTFQVELLDCMLQVLRECIVADARRADFVSIQVAETADLSNRRLAALVLRYIDGSHEVRERFFEFMPLQNATADSAAAALLARLESVLPADLKEKLVSQSYDGASILNAAAAGAHKKVRDVYANAHYVHSYAHQLGDIIQQVSSRVAAVRTFFSELSQFSSFFSRSQKRMAALDKVVAYRLPGASALRWDFHNQPVDIVLEYRQDLLRCFKSIRTSREFDPNTVREAAACLRLLEDDRFDFFLKLFHVILPHVDLLSRQLHKKCIDAVFIQGVMHKFARNIEAIRDSLPSVCDEHNYCAPALAKKRRILGSGDLNSVAVEVCDAILDHAKERFAFTAHLIGASLLQAERYQRYRLHFPEAALTSTVEAYPQLDGSKLKAELALIYEHDEYESCQSAVALYRLLVSNDLHDVLSETATLLKILVTTPMTTTESDRCFSTLNDIKTFLGNVVPQDGLNASAMLALETNLIKSIPDFNQRVIDKFTSLKDRRHQFRYLK
ncbi:zinc finger MYM-type protein 1-like [Vanacampus margaritifer]